jgi:hypothetical protein
MISQYLGEIQFKIEYQGKSGPIYKILQIDPDMLEEQCRIADWKLEILHSNAKGDYLARIF